MRLVTTYEDQGVNYGQGWAKTGGRLAGLDYGTGWSRASLGAANYGQGWASRLGAAAARTITLPNYGQGLRGARLGDAGGGMWGGISNIGGTLMQGFTSYLGYRGQVESGRRAADVARYEAESNRAIATEQGERTEGIVKLATLGFLGIMGLVGIGMLVTVTRRKNPIDIQKARRVARAGKARRRSLHDELRSRGYTVKRSRRYAGKKSWYRGKKLLGHFSAGEGWDYLERRNRRRR